MNTTITRRTIYLFLALALVLVLSFNALVDLRLTYLWFETVNYLSVFLRTYVWKGMVGLGLFLLMGGLSAANLTVAFKRGGYPHYLLKTLVISGVIGLLLAIEAGDIWFMVLQTMYRTPFMVKDPQFGLDISFYVFLVPFFKLLYRLMVSWVVLNLGAVLLIYLNPFGKKRPSIFEENIEVETSAGSGVFERLGKSKGLHLVGQIKSWKGWRHGAILIGLLVGFQALSHFLSIAELMHNQSGIVAGAGAKEIRMLLPGHVIMIGFSLLAGIMLAASHQDRIKKAFVLFASYWAISFVMLGVLPSTYQQFVVSPNEIARETPYLARSIEYTQKAYGLDRIESREYPVRDLDIQDLLDNQEVIRNVRILDQRATLTTYRQQQALRPYYEFADVDVDRYDLNGTVTQVMIAAREMNQDELPAQAQSFNNMIFQYTHGHGIVMSPANRVGTTGLPDYLVKDIPPVSTAVNITQPRIYYGERTNNNVIVKTKLPEFDFSDGVRNQEYFYEGSAGIPMTFLNRVMLSVRDMQYRYLFSSYITSESLYLETRNVRARAQRIAPFLWYDEDPYVVLNEQGGLTYILDAYTVTDRYPYAQRAENGTYNYIRNSAKVTVDAYTGDIHYYIFEEEDPILSTYSKIYPGLFKTREQFPEDLMSHVRYPETLFQVQSRMLQDYHMNDPVTFYNREDRWAFANQIIGSERMEQDPYYTISRLPGESREEFVLLRNFTPVGRQNMIAWLAGRSDGEDYGKLLLYTFTRGSQVPGPMQVESQIDQNPEISAQLSLWGQGGSDIIRGNLLVYPVGESLLYIEPLYMESTQNQFPQLLRVFVYYKDRIVMETSLEEALNRLFPGYKEALSGEEVPQLEYETPTPEIPKLGEGLEGLLEQLINLDNRIKEALSQGDWITFGQLQAEQEIVIGEIQKRLNPTLTQ